MKLIYKFTISFIIVNLLFLVIILHVYRVNTGLIKSYTNISKDHTADLRSSINAGNNAKLMESTLMMYLMFGNSKYLDQYEKTGRALDVNISVLFKGVKTHIGKKQLDILTGAAGQIRLHGSDLQDLKRGTPGKFDFRKHSDLIQSFHKQAASLRRAAIRIAQNSIQDAAVEIVSFAKRAVGHLNLYLTLGDPVDRKMFYDRLESLKKGVSTLRDHAEKHIAHGHITDLDTDMNSVEKIGAKLLDEYKKSGAPFNFTKHKILLLSIHKAAERISKSGLHMATHDSVQMMQAHKDQKKVLQSQNRLLVFFILIGMFGSLSVCLFVYRTIMSPLKKFKAATEEVMNGNLNPTLEISSNDEVGELAYRFQEMFNKLSSKHDELVNENEKRKQIEEISNRQLNHLTTVRSIDKAITSSLDLRFTLEVLLESVCSNMKLDAGTVLIFNPSTHQLEFIVSRGFQSDALKHTKLKLGESFAGKAALDREIVFVEYLDQAENSFSSSKMFEEEKFVSYYAVPLVAKGLIKGVLELFHRSRYDMSDDWETLFESIGDQAAIAIDNGLLFQDLQRSNLELTLAYDSTIEGWSNALELRDKETVGHSKRVTNMTIRMAVILQVDEKELIHYRRGALLHDIGKMGVPDSILLKTGPLSDEEFEIMKRHTEFANDMLYRIAYLRPSLEIPLFHHEKWDGSGYPRGLKGNEIPLSARIFAVVDVWDALRSDRSYRKAWPEEKVLKHMKSLEGSHFDPGVITAFLQEYVYSSKQN